MADLHYTTDGSKPTLKSPKYDPVKGIMISANTTIKAEAFLKGFHQEAEVVPAPPRTIVRIATSIWSDGTGFQIRKKVTVQKRLSCGDCFFLEDIQNGGADLVLKNILGFADLKDGLYEVRTVNEKKDWETGYVENWDYQFVPFKP